tara:strand:+ start:81 stop:425 length:345 start_codon:yes stop_codon:yes gene_type:complete
MKFDTAQQALAYIWHTSEKFANAKSTRVYLEEFKKTKKALLISSAPIKCKTIQERDSFAYSHYEYVQLLQGLREAIEQEETLKWKLRCAEEYIGSWRTREASARFELKNGGVAT